MKVRIVSVTCALAVAVVVVAACGSARRGALEEVGGDAVPPATAEPPGPPTAAPDAPPDPKLQQFASQVSEVPAAIRERMDGVSMRPGCPVGYDDLRYLRVSYWTFDSSPATGELVVHRDVADDVVGVFERLFDAHFPIRRMNLVDDFGRAGGPGDGADDYASIEADNTSAFNCRFRTASRSEFSQHSYGTAVDVNPLENPYVSAAGTTVHERSRPFLDRSSTATGVIAADGPAVAAFGSIGWVWGGTWSGIRDFQHFSRNGR